MYFLVITFHYIHEENKYPYPGIYPTPTERIERQIKALSKFFNFISQNNILDAINGKSVLPEKSCLLTFDDGLKSQYENALPLLEKLNTPAIFFVNALPYAEGKACLVHKIHYSRANLPPKVFLDKILDFIGKKIDFPDFEKTNIRNLYSDKEELKVKYLLNEYLSNSEKEKIIGGIFRELVDDEEAWCKEFYMSEKELSDLANRSFLGIHSYSHSWLVNCSLEDLKKDFQKNIDIIKKITNHTLKTISYPYGFGELSKAKKAAESVGLKIGFTLERAFNRTLQSPLLFARIDTNDAPEGKSPLLSFMGSKIILKKPLQEKRNLYFTENL